MILGTHPNGYSPNDWGYRIYQKVRPPGYDTNLHLMVRHQSWNLSNVGYPFITLLLGPLCPRVVVPVCVPSRGQIELFNHLTNK